MRYGGQVWVIGGGWRLGGGWTLRGPKQAALGPKMRFQRSMTMQALMLNLASRLPWSCRLRFGCSNGTRAALVLARPGEEGGVGRRRRTLCAGKWPPPSLEVCVSAGPRRN